MGHLIRRKIGKKVYLYYPIRTDRGPRQVYIGPEDSPDYSKIRAVLEIVTRREKQIYDERLELEALLPKEERRRREEIQVLATKLDLKEMEVIAKLSLTEKGLSPYELERRGIPPQQIMSTIRKLSELRIIGKKSETKTAAGRRIVRYTAKPLGAELALNYFHKTSENGLKEEKLRLMAEGDFDSTPLGVVYRQIQAVKIRGGTNS